MSVELIAGLVMVVVLTLVVGAAHLETQERQPRVSALTVLSAEDRHLLSLLNLTPGEWLFLTSQQRANLRERAYRGMD